MKITGTKLNVPAHLQPLFDAMKKGLRIKSVTCFAGDKNRDNAKEDFTIKDFKVTEYNASFQHNPQQTEYWDYVETDVPDRRDKEEKAEFYMHWVRAFELYPIKMWDKTTSTIGTRPLLIYTLTTQANEDWYAVVKQDETGYFHFTIGERNQTGASVVFVNDGKGWKNAATAKSRALHHIHLYVTKKLGVKPEPMPAPPKPEAAIACYKA